MRENVTGATNFSVYRSNFLYEEFICFEPSVLVKSGEDKQKPLTPLFHTRN